MKQKSSGPLDTRDWVRGDVHERFRTALTDAQETLQFIHDIVDSWDWIPEKGDVQEQVDRCLARIRVQVERVTP